MAISIENLFLFIVFLFDLFVVSYALYLSGRLKIERSIWLLIIYCAFNSICNLFTSLIIPLLTTPNIVNKINYYIYAAFTIVEYALFTFFIFLNLKKKGPKTIIAYASIFFVLFNIWHTSKAKPAGLDSIPIAIETILIFSYCVYYLYTQINTMEDMFIYDKYQFWMIIGIMVYLGGSFFIYILANIVSRKTLIEYWFLTYVFYIIKNILFAIGISLYKKKSKKTYHHKMYPSLN